MCFVELVVLPDWWKCTSIWLAGTSKPLRHQDDLEIPFSEARPAWRHAPFKKASRKRQQAHLGLPQVCCDVQKVV